MHASNPETIYSAGSGDWTQARLITVSGSARTVPVSHRDKLNLVIYKTRFCKINYIFCKVIRAVNLYENLTCLISTRLNRPRKSWKMDMQGRGKSWKMHTKGSWKVMENGHTRSWEVMEDAQKNVLESHGKWTYSGVESHGKCTQKGPGKSLKMDIQGRGKSWKMHRKMFWKVVENDFECWVCPLPMWCVGGTGCGSGHVSTLWSDSQGDSRPHLWPAAYWRSALT